MSGESLRLIGEEYRKSLMKRRPVPHPPRNATILSGSPEIVEEADVLLKSSPPTRRQVMELEDREGFREDFTEGNMYSVSRCSTASVVLSLNDSTRHHVVRDDSNMLTPFQLRKSDHPWYEITSGNVVPSAASSPGTRSSSPNVVVNGKRTRRRRKVRLYSRENTVSRTSHSSSPSDKMSVASISAVLSEASRKILKVGSSCRRV